MAKRSLHELYSTLLEQVYQDDLQSQRYYLSMIEDQRKIPVDYLIGRGVMFIPNNEYMKHYLGSDADSYVAGLYNGEFCNWNLFVTIPIMDLLEDIVGIAGWDAQNKYKELTEDAKDLPMYRVSGKNVFARDKYFLTDVPLLRSTFDSRTVFIVDGVFDSIALNYRGIPAIALLGSTVSAEVFYFLRWYKSIYLVQDNDDAGMMLYRRLSKALPSVSRVLQSKTKDIEELLRTDGANGPITAKLHSLMGQRIRGDVKLL